MSNPLQNYPIERLQRLIDACDEARTPLIERRRTQGLSLFEAKELRELTAEMTIYLNELHARAHAY